MTVAEKILAVAAAKNGVRYDEAIDPAVMNRQYTETDEPIEVIVEQPKITGG